LIKKTVINFQFSIFNFQFENLSYFIPEVHHSCFPSFLFTFSETSFHIFSAFFFGQPSVALPDEQIRVMQGLLRQRKDFFPDVIFGLHEKYQNEVKNFLQKYRVEKCLSIRNLRIFAYVIYVFYLRNLRSNYVDGIDNVLNRYKLQFIEKNIFQQKNPPFKTFTYFCRINKKCIMEINPNHL